ncbi:MULTISPECIES: hypothetical protein [Streptomyces]|uniref:NAD(P)-binding domain-containing protein n=2 Tax=Streptomyces TaxID=1883 RepID=A0ABV9IIZ0_9ACTN
MGDHRATEEELRESGMTWTVLRNAQCTDALVEAGARMPLRTPPAYGTPAGRRDA